MPDPSESVVVGYCHGQSVHADFHNHMINLLAYDSTHSRRILNGHGGFVTRGGSVNISSHRNNICLQFLDWGKADWLWMVDTDMTFEPDILDRLLENADPDKAPVVGGLCFGLDDKGMLFPTLYDITGTEEEPEFLRYDEWAPESMVQVFATGAACLLIHRSALEAVRDFEFVDAAGRPHKGYGEVFPWFQETDFYGRLMGEDITFCLRLGKAGVPVFVNTAVHLGHVKNRALTLDGYLEQRARVEMFREESA